MTFISYHMDLKALPTKDLKKCIRQKKYLNLETYAKIQAELLRRGEGYYQV